MDARRRADLALGLVRRSVGEWLWGVAWLAAVALVTWIVWQSFPDAPEAIKTSEIKGHVFSGYAVTMLAMTAIALVIAAVSR